MRAARCFLSSLVLCSLACDTAQTPAGIGTATGTITYSAPSSEVHALDLATHTDKKLLDDAESVDRFGDGRLLFMDYSDGVAAPAKLTIAAADGSGKRQIATPGTSVAYYNPTASPDGSKIAMTYYPRGFAHKLAAKDGTVVLDTNGAVVGNLENVFDPAWLPDGRLVLSGTVSVPSGSSDAKPTETPKAAGLFVSDAAFTTVTPIAGVTGSPQHPSGSRDGTRVAFARDGDVFTVGIDGTGLAQVTSGDPVESYPAFSPVGASLAMASSGFYSGAAKLVNVLIITAARPAQPVVLKDPDPATDIAPRDNAALSDSVAGRISLTQRLTWR